MSAEAALVTKKLALKFWTKDCDGRCMVGIQMWQKSAPANLHPPCFRVTGRNTVNETVSCFPGVFHRGSPHDDRDDPLHSTEPLHCGGVRESQWVNRSTQGAGQTCGLD